MLEKGRMDMGSKRVLIVDDSRSARHVLKRQLKQHGLTVDEVDSAEDALQYLLYRRPHAIFMDHTMPGMDGFQAVRIIKGNPATGLIPIMMYTSKEGGDVFLGQARALGAVGVIPKGIESADLAAALDSLKLLSAEEEPSPAPAMNAEALGPPAGAVEGEQQGLGREAAEEAMFRFMRPHLDAHARRMQSIVKSEFKTLADSLRPAKVTAMKEMWPAALGGVIVGVVLASLVAVVV